MSVEPLVALAPATDAAIADRFSGFYASYQPRLLRYLRRTVPSADVEAIAQEAFCRALAHWAELELRSDPWPWLAVAARNLARNQLRHDAQASPVDIRAFDSVVDAAADVEAQVCAYERLRQTKAAFAGLTEKQQLLVGVIAEHGLSPAEAGRWLGWGASATRNHMCRLRARLAKQLAGLEGAFALAPVAVWRWCSRAWLRGRGTLVLRSNEFAGGLAPAVLTAAVCLATSGFVTAGAPPVATRQPVVVAPVSVSAPIRALPAPPRPAPASVPAVAKPPAAATSRPAPAVAHPRPAVLPLAHTQRVTVSKTPTCPGRTADAELNVTVPLLSLTVSAPVDQYNGSANPAQRCSS